MSRQVFWIIFFVLGIQAASALAQDDAPPDPPEVEALPPEDNSQPDPPPAASDSGTGETAPATGAEIVPAGQELVNIDFPEPTEIKDIIRAVALWTGKNVILGKGVTGKVQMISPRKVTKEEAYQAFLSALNVTNLTTVETGKIIKILPVRTAVKGNLQIYQGSSWAPQTDKMITQIVPLKYIDAKQVQSTLSRIVSTNSMIAYSPTNTLIISDTGYKVRRILAILEILDIQGQQPRVALVPIRFADAKSIADKVGEILKASDAAKKGVSTGGAPGSPSSSYRVSVDERSNSVVIFGPPRTIADVKALVKQFDFPIDDPSNQASIRVRFLDYADAKKLATTLSSLAQGGQRAGRAGGTLSAPPIPGNAATGAGNRAGGAAPVADLGDNIKITADESANALLITGSRAAYDAINTIIRKLDQRRAQVYVEADILDVTIGSGFKFQTSIFAGSGSATGAKQIYGWQGGAFSPILEAQVSDDVASKAKAIGALSQNFTIGILSGAKIRLPGSTKDISPGALITMLKEDDSSRVLSSPHLLTSNNEKAKIVVGDKIFYESSTAPTLPGGLSLPKIEKEDVDLSLEIKPNVSLTSSYITLKIDLQANEVTSVSAKGIPAVGKRESSQLVTVKDGQTAVISGLVKVRESESYQKIPLLGDIPILGWLFRNSTLQKSQKNLMIFLTPHIVYGANDLAVVYERKMRERDEIMGKAFGSDFKEGDFMRGLPKDEDGRYRADAYDEIEKKNQGRFNDEIRRDMGYSDGDIRTLKGGDQGSQATETASPEAEPTPQPSPVASPEASIKKKAADKGSADTAGTGSYESPFGSEIEIGPQLNEGGDMGGADLPQDSGQPPPPEE